MKRLIYSFIGIVLSAAPFHASALNLSNIVSEKYSTTKVVEDTFNVTSDMTFVIENTCGNIIINNNNENKLIIKAIISAKNKKQENIENTLANVNVNISQEDKKISARTVANSSTQTSEYEVTYTISMPATMNINLSNRHGNVNIQDLLGKTNINVKHGNLTINKIKDLTNDFPILDLAYVGKTVINEIWFGGINLSYSNVTINKGQSVAITGGYSNIKILQTKSVAIDTKYGTINVDKVTNADITTKYADINIKRLENNSDINMKYGNLTIESISHNLTKINAELSYGNAYINTNGVQGINYKCNATHGTISLPKNNDSNGEKKSINVKCNFGSIKIN